MSRCAIGFVLAILLCFPLVAPVAAQEIDLSTGLPAVSYPTVPPQGGPRDYEVLWDLTHGVYLQYEPSGAFSNLVAMLNANSYNVTTTTSGIDNIDLSAYDVLVICMGSSWDSAYTPSEVAAAVDFVAGGGGILILGDNASVPVGNINPIAQAFGTTVGVLNISPSDLYFSNFIAHEIFNGVSQLYYRAAGELGYTDPSILAAWTDLDEPTVTLVDPCRVIVTGDMNCADNTYMLADDATFLMNVFQCLATSGPVPVDNSSWGSIKARFR
jgi:hypothetical protein